MEKDTRPRILCISDSASLDTGMGVAAREILSRLYKIGKWNLASFGWFWKAGQHSGCKWDFPWKQFSTDSDRYPYGHPPEWEPDYEREGGPLGNFKESSLYKVIDEFKPNIVIAIGDIWMLDYIYFLPNRNTFKLIHEFPIDGEPIPPSWIKLVRRADVAIVMSKYAMRVCKDVDPFVPLEYIPRGIDTYSFRPLSNKNELRKKYLASTENKFVVGVFDRFQDRKQIPRAVEGFAKFKKLHKVDNCDLYLHMCIDDAHSLQQRKCLMGENGIISRYGITNNILINKNLTVEKGVDTPTLIALYNCLSADTRVIRGDGTTSKIKDLVKHKYSGTILGLDNNKTVPVRVVGWYEKDCPDFNWIIVKTGNSKHARHIGTTCTPDHKWMTERGWIEARNLIIGKDRVPTMFHGSDDFIHGTLLGDGHASKKARLVVGHSNKDYAKIKAIHLGKNVKKCNRKGFGKYQPFYTVETGISREWRKLFYPNNKKVFVPPKSWASLAIWYGDDGCLATKTQPRFAIQSFNPNEVELWFRDWLRKSGGVGNVRVYRDGSLVINGSDKDIFFNGIAPYLPKSVRYKLPSSKLFKEYNGWLEKKCPQMAIIEDIIRVDISKEKYKSQKKLNKKYCLDVDSKQHSFFTVDGLVHNCCDIKLSSTQGEGFGRTVLEAMACGIPNIGTNYTTLPELLGDGRGLLANVATFITGMYNVERALVDTDSIASCLELLYRSEGLRKEIGERSREFALQFDWTRIIPKWESLFDKLLEPQKYNLMPKPREVKIEESIHEINIQGALYENTGFSIVTAGFARGLSSVGEHVSIEPRESCRPRGLEIAPDIDALTKKNKYNDVEIINHMPDECRIRLNKSTARIKIAYFPWELTEVKDGWIDLINREADAYACNSHFVADIFRQNGACLDKIYVIPNGICVDVNAQPYEFRTKKRYKFLMVGNLGDTRKNIMALIQAYLNVFTADDDVCLILKSQPGHLNSDPSELCENLCRSYPKPAEIEVIHGDFPDISGLYIGSDCFVTATRAEGFCQPALDSLSAGLPIIVPNYGGHLDFIDNGVQSKRVFLVNGNTEDSTSCPVHLPSSKWFKVDINELSKAMRFVYDNNIKRDGVNYVPENTWINAANKIVSMIKDIEKKPSKIKVFYKNFSKNMWNDDNRSNIIRYAPSNLEFIDEPDYADFQILDIAKLADFNNIKCKKYIINMHCKGEISEEDIKEYLPYFEKAVAVYSHLDLKTELPELINFIRGAWGTNHRIFYKKHDNTQQYLILNTGFVPQTEGIYESVAAASVVGKELIHTGPNLGIKNKEYNVCREFLTVEQLCSLYNLCSFTSGMRRIEGFEKTVAEGLLCGSRPICFDTPLFRYWYGDLVEYVREGSLEETTQDLVSIFRKEYRKVTNSERDFMKRLFGWAYVGQYYWKNIRKLMGV